MARGKVLFDVFFNVFHRSEHDSAIRMSKKCLDHLDLKIVDFVCLRL